MRRGAANNQTRLPLAGSARQPCPPATEANQMRHFRSELARQAPPPPGPGQQRSSALELDAELDVPGARLDLIRLDHPGPIENMFRQDDVFWVDLCLTPRRPSASARYIDHWSPFRFAELGAIIALPPGERLHLKSAGGRHASLICQLQAAQVFARLPRDFEWTDRRREACLLVANETIRALLLRLAQELRQPRLASDALCEAIVAQLSIELARHLVAVREPTEKGGLAAWRLRAIDARIAEPGNPPCLEELAALCRISIRHLSRGFRTSRGCSIGDYLAQSRIEAAKRRLAGDESIKLIASSMGFSSQSNFTSAFRRATGVTPSDFRARLLKWVEQPAGQDSAIAPPD